MPSNDGDGFRARLVRGVLILWAAAAPAALAAACGRGLASLLGAGAAVAAGVPGLASGLAWAVRVARSGGSVPFMTTVRASRDLAVFRCREAVRSDDRERVLSGLEAAGRLRFRARPLLPEVEVPAQSDDAEVAEAAREARRAVRA